MRYDHLIDIIKAIHPQRIMEIGTSKGDTALKMIKEAVKHRDDVEYYGFDLFEMIPDGMEKDFQHPVKAPHSAEKIFEMLSGHGALICLYKGDTKYTLAEPMEAEFDFLQMDLIFIDGGHSYETIESDWNHVQRLMHDNTVVIFDDYWTGPALTDPTYSKGGCKPLIDSLEGYNVEILEPVDKFKYLWTQFVKVTR